ncbi:MAG TPA: trehalose-6-phosphate synthase [Bryobacteraceae bacterium]|nr:trehalose-6-phosphate synthase [Bryobacteraceae bacterium]
MRRLAQFVLALLLALGLLAWVVTGFVQQTARKWFERDVMLRARLVVAGARASLAAHWSAKDHRVLRDQLADMARDERVMAAAACGADYATLAATPNFPEEWGCAEVGPQVESPQAPPATPLVEWDTVSRLPGGSIHVSAIPVWDGGRQIGFVVLIHDLSYAERRAASTRNFLLVLFGLLGLGASAITILVGRLSQRGWMTDLRGMLHGDKDQRPEFQPILRDVRDLIERVMDESETGPGIWTPARLKTTLSQNLHGERVVILANREPYVHEHTARGEIEALHPASGLVTALEPVMRACSGVWVAHGSGEADRETVDRRDHVRVPPGEESYHIRRVWLTSEEELGYYYGFSNEGLWPLCHMADARPTFRTGDWDFYRSVNRRFAEAVCEEVDSDDPIILVQDYHFALAPAMIRKMLPAATVIMFWHIPWPNAQRIGICPWRNEILEGLLGSSILGFHTQSHCNNFFGSVDEFMESRIDREKHGVVLRGHRTLVRPYPISLEWPVRWLASAPSVAECRAEVWREHGLRPDALLGVGVDRLDYTKGVAERLLTVERLLERYPEFRGRFSFIQLAAPSRTKIERYQELNTEVEELAQRVNQRFGDGDYRPIILLRSHHEPPAVFRYYRAAHLCYVSSLHDGMNLVAKEFVASRDDLAGVLVLSQFTGAARELTEALIVNPYDVEQSSDALATALRMPALDQQVRMRSMRSLVAHFNVYRWAGEMLADAAQLRRHERLAGRLAERLGARADS